MSCAMSARLAPLRRTPMATRPSGLTSSFVSSAPSGSMFRGSCGAALPDLWAAHSHSHPLNALNITYAGVISVQMLSIRNGLVVANALATAGRPGQSSANQGRKGHGSSWKTLQVSLSLLLARLQLSSP